MALINRESFTATGPADEHGAIPGTVEVTLRGVTRRVRARRDDKYGWVFAYGMTGRYVSGGKAWPASVKSDADGSECVNFGRDDRSGRFNKANGLYFAD